MFLLAVPLVYFEEDSAHYTFVTIIRTTEAQQSQISLWPSTFKLAGD